MRTYKCPACSTHPARVFRCDVCGDTRCAFPGCPGTHGGAALCAHPNGLCVACGKGRYRGPI